eukprot:2700086-Rhodomonas_salina.2
MNENDGCSFGPSQKIEKKCFQKEICTPLSDKEILESSSLTDLTVRVFLTPVCDANKNTDGDSFSTAFVLLVLHYGQDKIVLSKSPLRTVSKMDQ